MPIAYSNAGIRYVEFIAAGTYTFVVPPGVTGALLDGVGGGGRLNSGDHLGRSGRLSSGGGLAGTALLGWNRAPAFESVSWWPHTCAMTRVLLPV